MNLIELEQTLKTLKISPQVYLLGGGLPNEQYVLSQEQGKWMVYYSERGVKSGLRMFDSESEACEYLLQLLKSEFGLQ